MSRKKIFAGWDCLTCARWLVVAEVVSLFISTSLTSVIETLLFGCVLLCARRFRERIVFSIRQPIVIMTLLFGGVLCLGMFYGPASLAEKFAILKGWRKLLLLPVAVLLFDDVRWKQRLTWAVIGIAIVCMLRSYVGLLGFGPTIVVHNHATQGMFFAVAAFAAVIMVFSPFFPCKRSIRWGVVLGVMLLIVNIIVTPGRSGYLSLLVLACTACYSLFRGWRRTGMMVSVPFAIIVLLAVSPLATKRLEKALHEMQRYEQLKSETDMGMRMVMWKNTLQLIEERPVLGYGLGGLKEAYRKQVEGVKGWQGIAVDDPHNQYLKIAAEHGLVGLLVFFGFIRSFFRQEVVATNRMLGLGVLLAWCATSFFSGHFSTSGEGRFIMLWAGAQLAMEKLPVGTESD